MNLDIFNKLSINTKENNEIQFFIKELSNYIKNETEGGMCKIMKKKNNDKLQACRQENCLYQVVDRSKDGVYLQNLSNNKIFEEKNLSKELLDKIGNDYILRYKEGQYIFEEKLTDDFFNGLN